jgi:hypothetical protein
MKVFEIRASTSEVHHLDVSDKKEISLGESGKGRKLVSVQIVGCGNDIKPLKIDGKLTLIRGSFPLENRCLIVINCDGIYRRNFNYDIFNPNGVFHLATGYRSWGESGELGIQPHYLSIVSSGGSFHMNHSIFGRRYYYFNNGNWTSESASQRQARLAYENFILGEGEWL